MVCELFLKKSPDFSTTGGKGICPYVFVGVCSRERRDRKRRAAARKLLQGTCLFIVTPPLPRPGTGHRRMVSGTKHGSGEQLRRTGCNSLVRGPGGRRWSQHETPPSPTSSLETPHDTASRRPRAKTTGAVVLSTVGAPRAFCHRTLTSSRGRVRWLPLNLTEPA